MTIQIHGIDYHLNIGALSALPDDAPVVMLNLMRFATSRSTARAAAGTPTCATARSPSRSSRRGGTIIAIRETYHKLASTKE
jgi:hypothetical protein